MPKKLSLAEVILREATHPNVTLQLGDARELAFCIRRVLVSMGQGGAKAPDEPRSSESKNDNEHRKVLLRLHKLFMKEARHG